jgi:hypothetical protein
MKQDKFLTGILIGIGVLIVIALALFFTRKDTKQYTRRRGLQLRAGCF